MKISLIKQFYKNLRHPREAAMFRLLKVGYNIFYCFFLTLVAAILFSPTIIKQTVETSETLSFIFIPLMLILYYILLCAVAFFFVSILGTLGLLVKKLLKRKLNYLQVWSITINAITWPTLLLTIINVFLALPTFIIWFYIAACLIMLINMIVAVPKPKRKVMGLTRDIRKSP